MSQNDRSKAAKDIIDSLGRVAIIVMVIWIEYGLLKQLAQEGGSGPLLAAIVVLACLPVLSLTAFRGSLDQDVREIKDRLKEIESQTK